MNFNNFEKFELAASNIKCILLDTSIFNFDAMGCCSKFLVTNGDLQNLETELICRKKG